MAGTTTFLSVTPTMRQLIENVIEDLLLLLDEIDGDADFEDDESEEDADFEPSIGTNECLSQGRWGFGPRDDREDDPAEHGEPDPDCEIDDAV